MKGHIFNTQRDIEWCSNETSDVKQNYQRGTGRKVVAVNIAAVHRRVQRLVMSQKMVHPEAFSRPLSRNEVVGLIFRLTIFGAVTYFTIKWMVDAIDPTRKQKIEAQKQAEKLMRQIGVKNVKLTEYEMSIAAHLVDPLSMQVTWSDIAGLDEVITDLKDTVILPIRKKHLFENSRLLQPPKGVLLYGPPGCGKTLIAKATAKEAGCRFINLQPSTLTDKWYGESQKLAAAVFSLAVKLQPSIIFIDEIDSFLRSRSSTDHEATAMMKAQFMSLWDGLDTDYSCQVVVMGATNRPQDLDTAIMRRMPTRFHINQPSMRQREAILNLILRNENVDLHVDLVQISSCTEGFSGSDLKEMCRDAALLCVRDSVLSNTEESPCEEIRPIQQQDLMKAIDKMKKSKSATSQGVLMHRPTIRPLLGDRWSLNKVQNFISSLDSLETSLDRRTVQEESREAERSAGGQTAHGIQGKHRVTKRGPALSYPMFTLVTGIVGRWRAVCVTALQRPNSDAAAIRIVVGIAAASLNDFISGLRLDSLPSQAIPTSGGDETKCFSTPETYLLSIKDYHGAEQGKNGG
ncbi:unnamed protein product [Ranitomeya imitator]|uniref:Outer mitochondrial transmembrane helix translocase n=1 Tax=Ranitomeya imitator TaxID=111125 RepID=A0ABN9KMX6_9NEOB|nr:unnamed protein product [Ranitomeya imitator]